jgi:hypothetical protein
VPREQVAGAVEVAACLVRLAAALGDGGEPLEVPARESALPSRVEERLEDARGGPLEGPLSRNGCPVS